MLNALAKQNSDKIQENSLKKLDIFQIEKYYTNKKNNEFLFGLEYERLSLDKHTLENAPYIKMEKIISDFSKVMRWNLIYDNQLIIGAICDDGSSISLEPGCQIEVSLAPKKDILSIELAGLKIIKKLDEIASLYDIVFVGYGISPVSSPDEIDMLQKRRYKVMSNYLPNRPYGELSSKMMRQTAGMQINIDYSDCEDLYLKLKFFNQIMPFMCALCSNSPLENNKLSDKKSLRANVWRFTGSERCNLFYKNIFDGVFSSKNVVRNYINSVLDVPMIFIERNNEIVEINGKITFAEFMKNGYLNYNPTMEDYILHQSLCFPDVRLKNYIEIRNHDSADFQMALALCAFYKGLSFCDLEKILSELNYLKINDVALLNKKIVFEGLDVRVTGKIDGWDVIVKLFNFAKEKLNAKERAYLQPILNMIKNRKTNADVIMDYNIDSASDLIEFLY
ncbi:hypothetical protein IJ425_05330 [bacterium]|nr:hypothetical protein [bacterium]